MNKLYKIYESVLVESTAEACIKNFGYDLFADELGGKERNTSIENKYVDDIQAFTDNMYGQDTNSDFIKAVKVLKGCMGQYPEVLVPDDTTVYRGTMIPLSYFIKNNQQINIKGVNRYVYQGHTQVQSWTTSLHIAEDFGDNEMINDIVYRIPMDNFNSPGGRKKLIDDLLKKDLRLAFVLSYHTTPDDFMFKSKYFNKLSNIGNEDEILRINNRAITTTAKFNTSNLFSHISNEAIDLIKYINAGINGV